MWLTYFIKTALHSRVLVVSSFANGCYDFFLPPCDYTYKYNTMFYLYLYRVYFILHRGFSKRTINRKFIHIYVNIQSIRNVLLEVYIVKFSRIIASISY